jgi:ferritin-like metal-binding protein YciE
LRRIQAVLSPNVNAFAGTIEGETARTVVHAAMGLYSSDQINEAKSLVRVLKSKEVFDAKLADIVASHFELATYSLPTD